MEVKSLNLEMAEGTFEWMANLSADICDMKRVSPSLRLWGRDTIMKNTSSYVYLAEYRKFGGAFVTREYNNEPTEEDLYEKAVELSKAKYIRLFQVFVGDKMSWNEKSLIGMFIPFYVCEEVAVRALQVFDSKLVDGIGCCIRKISIKELANKAMSLQPGESFNFYEEYEDGKGTKPYGAAKVELFDSFLILINYWGGGYPFCIEVTRCEECSEPEDKLKQYLKDIKEGRDYVYLIIPREHDDPNLKENSGSMDHE